MASSWLSRRHIDRALPPNAPRTPWGSLRPRWWLPVLGYTSESAELGIVTVANQSQVVQRVLQKVEDFLETTPSIRVIELERELL